jgi:hypothetical protein
MPFEMHPVRRRRISVAAVSTLFSTLLFTLPGCAILNPPDRTELTQQALAETALPAVWKFAKTPGEFDAETLGFELPEELATLIREGQANNPDLRLAATRVEQSRIAVKGGWCLSGTGFGRGHASRRVGNPFIVAGNEWSGLDRQLGN